MINKLINEDAVIELSKIKDSSIDCIIIDPPYYKVLKDAWDNQWKNNEDYLLWFKTILLELYRILKNNSSIFVFSSRQNNFFIQKLLFDCGFNENRNIIWARKRNIDSTRGHSLSSGYEPLCWFYKGDTCMYYTLKIKSNSLRKEYTTGFLKDGVNLSDCWLDIPALAHNSKEKVDHPSQKPISLIERIIQISTKENDLVLDCFAGSGTTGIACKKLNRNFILIEKEKEYCLIAEKRINN